MQSLVTLDLCTSLLRLNRRFILLCSLYLYMSKIKAAPDYIGCHYYSWNIENLRIAHKYQATASASRNQTFLPGNLVLICASQHDGLYAFLAQAEYVYPDRVASDIWKDFHRPDHDVTKLKVLTPIKLIPSAVHGDLARSGIMKCNRSNTVRYLRGSLATKPAISKQPPTIIEIKPKEKTPVITYSKDTKPEPKFGFVYILKHAVHGYKIGITADIKRRFNQLEVGTKAECVGIWSSEDYKTIEKHLHSAFFQERCPQSEWFDISTDQLYTAINLLDKYASCITCTPIEPEPTEASVPSKVSSKPHEKPSFVPLLLVLCIFFGGIAIANDPQVRPYSEYEQVN